MPPANRDASSGGRQARPLHYARLDLDDDGVRSLPGLDKDGTILGYAPAFTLIRVRGGEGIAWRDDGDAPATDAGMPVEAPGELPYDGDPLNLQIVRLGDRPVVVHVAYYARPDDA